MKTLKVKIPGAADTEYPICIGSNVLSKLPQLLSLAGYSSVCVVTDTHVAKHWLAKVKAALGRDVYEVIVPAGESAKHATSAAKIWRDFLQYKLDRSSLAVNLGGGVIGDLAGFAASTYMRGIDFVQLPTTLLSQVDASVGGKVGINVGGVKNLVGTFNQPKAVVIDVDTLSTLPPRELNSGFAEVIKHGMIADKDYFELVRKLTPAKVTATQYVDLIEGSCRIKSRVVEQDEKEAGLRKILNFGHTVGHALEALSHEGGEILLHGEAVALGMVAEAHISKEVGLIDSKVVSELEDVLERFALPTRLKDMVPVEKLYQLMSTDKKNLAGSIKWTLLEDLGKATFDCDVPRKVVERALAALYQEEQ